MNVIEVQNVFKSIGKREIIKNISFKVKEEKYLILGKTVLERVLQFRQRSIKVMGHVVRTDLVSIGTGWCHLENQVLSQPDR